MSITVAWDFGGMLLGIEQVCLKSWNDTALPIAQDHAAKRHFKGPFPTGAFFALRCVTMRHDAIPTI